MNAPFSPGRVGALRQPKARPRFSDCFRRGIRHVPAHEPVVQPFQGCGVGRNLPKIGPLGIGPTIGLNDSIPLGLLNNPRGEGWNLPKVGPLEIGPTIGLSDSIPLGLRIGDCFRRGIRDIPVHEPVVQPLQGCGDGRELPKVGPLEIGPTIGLSDSIPLGLRDTPIPSSNEGRGGRRSAPTLSSGAEQCSALRSRNQGSRERLFHFPPWARVQIVSPETGREVADGGTGLIRIFDLANLRSVLAIQTEDLGIRRGDGFHLLGRVAPAEARGCSLMSA
jgi:hypothetical protein